MITPLVEASPIPDTTTIGVAMTNAQGHATTITTNDFFIQTRLSNPINVGIKNTKIAIMMTIGVYIFANEVTNDSIGELLAWAS